jgi:nicotinamidase-related amidase
MKTALIALDFINDIVDLNGKFTATAKFVHEHHVINRANEVIAHARKQAILPIFVRVGFSAGYPECPVQSPLFGKAKEHNALVLNSWGTEFHKTLNFQSRDLVVTKHRVNAFYATPLEAILRANQIQHLIMLGVSTDMAVQTTVRDAHDRDYSVTVVSDACGAGSMETHSSTIRDLAHIARVVLSHEAFKA